MTRHGPFTRVRDGVQVRLKVIPRARRACLDGLVADAEGDERLKLRVTAAPAEGAANEAVTKLLAKALRVPASSIAIVAGAHDRNKTVLIRGDAEALLARLKSIFEELT
jgi:uncharacterized protein (TIGR00251 family)